MKNLTLYILFSILLFSCKRDEVAKIGQKHLVKVIQGHSDSQNGTVVFDRIALEVGYNQDFSRLLNYSVRDVKSNGIEYNNNNRITKILAETSSVNVYPGLPINPSITSEFLYDNSGRLTKITEVKDRGTLMHIFTYDNLGRLITREIGIQKTQYTYTGNNVLPDGFDQFSLNVSIGKSEIKFSDKPSPYISLKELGFSLGYYFGNSILEEGTDYIYDGNYLIKTYNKFSGAVELFEYL